MSSANRSEHPVEAISAFIDGELRGSELEMVAAHLAVCESCRMLAEDLRRIARATPEAARPEVPAGLDARIKSRLRSAPQASRRRRFVLPVAVAATLGALAIFASLQLRPARSLPETVQRPSVESSRPVLDQSAVDEVTAGKKQSEADARGDLQRSDRSAGAREDKAVSLREPEARQKAAAVDSAFKDRLSSTSAPAAPPPAAAPSSPLDRERSTDAQAEEKQDAGNQFAPAPPPPAPSRELQKARAERTNADDAKHKKEVSAATESGAGAAGAAPSGVMGGVADGPASDFASRCPSPWRARVDVSWDSARSGDPESVLATVARDYSGQVIAGRDERSRFVSLLLPAAAWPGVFEKLRALGASVPSSPPPLPDGTLCVRLDVRTQEKLQD